MKYIKQNDSGLYLPIQKIGCFFRAALHMAELHEEKALTINQINALWDAAHALGYIGVHNGESECVLNSAKIGNLALRKLGNTKGQFIEVGSFAGGRTNFYPAISPALYRVDYLIQKIRQGGPSKTHFRNVKNDGTLEWDPHEPEIVPLSIDYSILYIYQE